MTKNFIDSENMLPHFWSFFIKLINFQPRDVCNGSHWTREPGQYFVFNSFSQSFSWIILLIINRFLFPSFFWKTIIFDNFEEKSVKYFEKFCNKNYKMWLRHIIKQTLNRNFEKKSLTLLRKNQKIPTELVKNLGEKIFFRLLKVNCFFYYF